MPASSTGIGHWALAQGAVATSIDKNKEKHVLSQKTSFFNTRMTNV